MFYFRPDCSRNKSYFSFKKLSLNVLNSLTAKQQNTQLLVTWDIINKN